mgnify:FL=1|tara:strand:- start:511 stop:804 length:294 start_codon:yes stop_codon:yes gene_type:complete
MGSLIKGSINLNKLPKEKLIKGKNGTYYDFTISVNDETGDYGDNCSMFDSQTKEEREAKTPKNYVGNAKVIWTDGTITTAERQEEVETEAETADLPF